MSKARGPARPCVSRPKPYRNANNYRARFCLVCGQGFKPSRASQVYCSNACQNVPRQRSRPHDFEEVFVRIGRLLCEEWYRARRKVITRWMHEVGYDELRQARSEHVRARFEAEREQRDLDRRMRAAIRDKYANAAADLTDGVDPDVGSG